MVPSCEGDVQRVGAVIGAVRPHVDHVVHAVDRRSRSAARRSARPRSAEAPGKRVVTDTCGGTMSGNCATGMRIIASAPASVGDDGDDDREARPVDEDGGDHARSAPRPAAAPPGVAVRGAATGAGFTGWPGRTRCRPSTTTVSPPCRPSSITAVSAGGAAERDVAPRRAVVLAHHEDEGALLVLQHGRARQGDGHAPAPRPRPMTVTNCPSTSSRGRDRRGAWPSAGGSGWGSARAPGWCRCCGRSGCRRSRSARPRDRSAHRRCGCAPAPRAGPPRPSKRLRRSSAVRWLTAKATRIGSWLTMVASVPASGPTTLPDRQHGAADLPGDRRGDLGVAEVDLRHAHRRLGRQHVGRGGAFQRLRVVERHLRAGAGLAQFPRAGQRDAGILERAPWRRRRWPGPARAAPRRARVRAGTARRPRFTSPPSRNRRSCRKPVTRARMFDAVDRLDPADEFDGLGDGPAFGDLHAHRRRALRAELRGGGKGRGQQQRDRADAGDAASGGIQDMRGVMSRCSMRHVKQPRDHAPRHDPARPGASLNARRRPGRARRAAVASSPTR